MRTGRRLSFEPLEDRRVLSAVKSAASPASPGGRVVDSGAHASVACNRGDFYYSVSALILLLRWRVSLISMV